MKVLLVMAPVVLVLGVLFVLGLCRAASKETPSPVPKERLQKPKRKPLQHA